MTKTAGHPSCFRNGGLKTPARLIDFADSRQNKGGRWLQYKEYLRLGRSDADRQAAYRQLFKAAVSNDDLREIRECTHKGWALGSDRFKEQIERLTRRPTVSKGVERPRKESGVSERAD